MVSQLLFGDQVEIIETSGNWRKIRNGYDGYEGWIDFKQLQLTEDLAATAINHIAPATVNNTLTAQDDSVYYIAASSNLPNYKDGYCFVGDSRFKVEFQPLVVDFSQPQGDIRQLALFFQNAPYLWGGRTLSGIDCSGFVQAVFKMAGVKLRRDASQQAEEGATVDFLPEVRTGDVAFFDNEDGKIIHVGILLNYHEIIHASGKVRIDLMDDQGIFNKELNKYTHKLRIIKRFI